MPAGGLVVLNLGMGVDSAAILTRHLLQPATRDYALANLVVITAMTGDEWPDTGRLVETHLLPLMREHRVRYVQVARTQRRTTQAGDGVAVLSDTREPWRVHLDGAYRLSEEMLEAGTIPQSGGARLCSVHAKGDALDPVIARIADGRPYRQILGFEANEGTRARKDTGYNTAQRTGEYPLIAWGWDRAACERYLTNVHGVVWRKSACTMCPFALQNHASRVETLARYAEDPVHGVDALVMEHVALSLNDRQGLVGGRRLVDLIRARPDMAHVLAELELRLAGMPHAVYEVRRVVREANTSRSVRAVAHGPREAMAAVLRQHAAEHATTVDVGPDGHARVWLRRRDLSAPTVERFYVAAPAVVHDKAPARFDEWYARVEAGPRVEQLGLAV